METARLSTKGQIVLPQSIREAHSWGPGTVFECEEVQGGVLLKPKRRFPRTTVDQVYGILKVPRSKRKSIAQMNRAIDLEVQSRHDRGRY